MIKKSLFFLFLLISFSSYSQGSSAVLAWILGEDKARNLKEWEHQTWQRTNAAKTIKHTIDLVNLAKETKKITQQISGATQEFNNLYKRVIKDAENVDFSTKGIYTEMMAFADLQNDWEQGKALKPIGIGNFYEQSTKKFRNKNGTISLSATISNQLTAEKKLATMANYNIFYYHMGRIKLEVFDDQIYLLLSESESIMRKTAWMKVKLNLIMLGKDAINNANGYLQFTKAATGQKVSDQELITAAEKKVNEERIEKMMEAIAEADALARAKRQQAIEIWMSIQSEYDAEYRRSRRLFYDQLFMMAAEGKRKEAFELYEREQAIHRLRYSQNASQAGVIIDDELRSNFDR